jgi:hypothetical protein
MNYCSVSAITFCNLSTSSVRRYSIFFTSVSNSSLYVMSFLSSAVKTVFRTQDKLLRKSTRARKGLALVRLFLLLQLFLELGVGLLKIMEIVLEKPCLSCPLLFQLIELSLKIYVPSLFF